MNLNDYIVNNTLKIKVIPNSSKTELVEKNKHLKLYLKAVPDKNKANLELIQFFKKRFNLNINIIRGQKSREKMLKVF